MAGNVSGRYLLSLFKNLFKLNKLLVCILILVLNLNQSGLSQTIFQKSLHNQDERITDFIFDNDSSIYFSSIWKACGPCSNQPVLLKTNMEFDPVFSYKYADSAHASQILLVDDGVILFGFDRSIAEYNHFILKTDFDGNLLWSKSYGSEYIDIGKISKSSAGGFLIGGNTYYQGVSGVDSTCMNLIKIDANGNMLWERTYFLGQNINVTGITELTDTTIIISGTIADSIGGFFKSFVINADESGSIIWAKKFGLSNKDLYFNTSPVNFNSLIYLAGCINFNSINYPYIVSIDDTGAVVMSTSFIRPNGGTIASSLAILNNVNKIGISLGPGVIICDYAGNFIESHTYLPNFPANSQYYKVWSTFDNGIFLGGYNTGNNDMYVVKTDSFYNGGCGMFDVIYNSNPELILSENLICQELFINIEDSILNFTRDSLTFSATVYCSTATSIYNYSSDSELLTVYPNPFDETIFIELHNHFNFKNCQLEILDIMGRKVLTSIIDNSPFQITLKNAAGIYFVILYIDNDIIVRKIIKN